MQVRVIYWSVYLHPVIHLTSFVLLNTHRLLESKRLLLQLFDGGRMKEIADQGVHIPTGNKEYGPAEDLHMILDHLIGSYLMRLIKK